MSKNKKPIKKTVSKADQQLSRSLKNNSGAGEMDHFSFTKGKATRRTDPSFIIPDRIMTTASEGINDAFNALHEYSGIVSLSPAQRRLLNSVRSRRMGFIVRATELAAGNPEYTTKDWDQDDMNDLVSQLMQLDDMLADVDALRSIVSDLFIKTADEAFRMSRIFYGNVQMRSRMKDEGALAIYNRLNEFFRMRHPLIGVDGGGGGGTVVVPEEPEEPGDGDGGGGGIIVNPDLPGTDKPTDPPTDPQPNRMTQKQLKRDVDSLMKGRKNGEVVIENQKPVLVGGYKKVVDMTSKPATTYAEKTIYCPVCNEELPEHADVCLNCGARIT
jgi:hypothetical protein